MVDGLHESSSSVAPTMKAKEPPETEPLHSRFRALILLTGLVKEINGRGVTRTPQAGDDDGQTLAPDLHKPPGVLIAAANLLVRDNETVSTAFLQDPESQVSTGVIAVTSVVAPGPASSTKRDSNNSKWSRGFIAASNADRTSSNLQGKCVLVPKGKSLQSPIQFGLVLSFCEFAHIRCNSWRFMCI
jgi:hypothetical protein